jgi:hypothetical protein
MSGFSSAASLPYWADAELEYRRERARQAFGASSGRRRHRVPRRPSLTLPHRRRRPLAVA